MTAARTGKQIFALGHEDIAFFDRLAGYAEANGVEMIGRNAARDLEPAI